MQHLMLVSIGPVQEFIASARRSRDLWFGSWLLSELSKAAAKVIVAQEGLTSLIFPAPADENRFEDSGFSVANKLVARISQHQPKDVAAEARKGLNERLEEIWADAYDHIEGTLLDLENAWKQRNDLIEYAWVALPLSDERVYPDVRKQLEALMAARKVTRTFNPVTWGNPIPKSSLDGQRESVIRKEAYGLPDLDLYHQYGVRPGEQLCGIGLLKRHGRRGKGEGADRFFSTSHVAALPLIQRLHGASRRDLAIYINKLRHYGVRRSDLGNVPGDPHPIFKYYDGHLLFEERLREYLPPGANGDRSDFEAARKALREFLKQATSGKQPQPYYALLHADGDGMGKAIDAQATPDAHRKLSRALDQFAGEVRNIVGKHRGSLVYAGGDDVLAFVPLHTALTCARDLADRFRTMLSSFTYRDAGADRSPTLSIGVAVAHHLEPLSDALEAARAAERRAKQEPHKNALAITVLKRSGIPRTVVGEWNASRGEWAGMDRRVAQFVKLHGQNAIPDGLAYEWSELHRRMKTPDKQLAASLREPLSLEAQRILERKRAEQGTRKIDDATLVQLRSLIATVALDKLADEIIVARIFADATRLAETT